MSTLNASGDVRLCIAQVPAPLLFDTLATTATATAEEYPLVHLSMVSRAVARAATAAAAEELATGEEATVSAEMAAAPSSPTGRLLAAVADRAADATDMNGGELAALCWALAAADVAHEAAWRALVAHAIRLAPELAPEQLGDVSWAMGRMQRWPASPQPKLFEALAERAASLAPRISPQVREGSFDPCHQQQQGVRR
jgi:hypothetical protein